MGRVGDEGPSIPEIMLYAHQNTAVVSMGYAKVFALKVDLLAINNGEGLT